MSDLLIGIDIGTTTTKVGVYQSSGKLIAEASRANPLRRHGPDACDQNPNDFYQGAVEAISRCLIHPEVDSGNVRAIGVAGQMAGVLGVDVDFNPSTPYDSWLDLRCSPDVSYLERELGDALIEKTGCAAMINHAPKMRWWRREEPSAYRETAKFVMPGGYVAGKLAGLSAADAFIDRTYLHFTGVADARCGCWSPELLRVVGVGEEKLPQIVEPTAVIGGLQRETAERTGLRQGVPIAAGLGDTAAATLGSGVVRSNQLLDVAGTAAVFAGSTADFRPDTADRTLIVMRGAVQGQWISLAYLSGGGLLSWFDREVLGRVGDGEFPDVTAGVETVAAGSDGLVFVPHLDGQILPSNPMMRGAWLGLNRQHTKPHLVRSILESVAYEYDRYLRILRRLHPEFQVQDVRVVGGGAHSDVWNAVKASVLGLTYARLDRDELGCWGAALVAGHAVGLIPDLAAAAEASTTVRTQFEPETRAHERYQKMTEIYAAAVESIKVPSAALAAIQGREDS